MNALGNLISLAILFVVIVVVICAELWLRRKLLDIDGLMALSPPKRQEAGKTPPEI